MRYVLALGLALGPISAFTQTLTLTLTPSDFNGYNISCFGKATGSIDLAVTGGTPPYTYSWSTSETTQDVADIPAGYYVVKVEDASLVTKYGNITLTEPEAMKLYMEPFVYPTGKNITCFNCYNGSIQVTTEGGVAPYTYLWGDGATSEDRANLGSGNYSYEVSDANGCMQESDKAYLSEPERNDWQMGGNAGTSPASQYIGTSDAQDVVFKTNGAEALRVLNGGDIRINSLTADSGYRLVVADSLGVLKILGGPYSPWNNFELGFASGCPGGGPWMTCGNYIGTNQFLGSLNNLPLVFKTFNEQQMIITTDGKVGIGTNPPTGALGQYRLFVEDGIVTRDVLVKTGNWPDHVFDPRYALMPFDELRAFLTTNKHLPGIPSAADVEAKNGVEVGDLQTKMLKVIEEQALYILELEGKQQEFNERQRHLEQRLSALEASQR